MKPRLISSLLSTFVAERVSNPRHLLCYGIEATRIQIEADTSSVPTACDWKKITVEVADQLEKTFGTAMKVSLIDADTEEELTSEAGGQEADVVCLKITVAEQLPSVYIH